MKYKVTNVNVVLCAEEILVAGAVGVYSAEFIFDESWDGYTSKIAVFKHSNGVEREQPIEDGKCVIPWEVLRDSGTLVVGVYGETAEKLFPTLWANSQTIYPGTAPSDITKEPTPDKWQQVLGIIEALTYNVTPRIGENGNWYVGDTDTGVKVPIKPVASNIILASSEWVDDSDIYPTMELRFGYRKHNRYEAQTLVRDAYNPLKLTYEWQDFILPFTLAEDTTRFVPFFQGNWSATDIHPYDIMACKLYVANDADKTNFLDDDIEMQDWVSEDGLSETALLITDGARYKHVFRQEKNYAEVRAISRGRAITLAAGDYVFECRLRMTPWLRFVSVPVTEAHSENCVTVSPSNDTAEAYASHNIRCEAFGSETLIFSCDEIPGVDIKANAMVNKATGAEGLIFQPMKSGVYSGVVDTALLDTIGSGVIE